MLIKTRLLMDRYWKGVSKEKGNDYYNVLLRGIEQGKSFYMYSKVPIEDSIVGKEIECVIKMWKHKKNDGTVEIGVLLEDIEKVY